MSGSTMWVKRLVAPGTFGEAEAPRPTGEDLKPGEVLLRTLVGGICGSDLPYFRGLKPLLPLQEEPGRYAAGLAGFPLHEVVGEVVASQHPEHSPGDLVVGWAIGMDGLSQFVVTPGDVVASYDSTLEPAQAIMLQPLACVIHAVGRMRPVVGKSVAVLGQGSIGVLFSHVIKTSGATRVIGVDRTDRADVVSIFGVDDFVHTMTDRWAGRLSATADADRPQAVIEAIGHQIGTLADAIEAVEPGGEVLYFGIPDNRTYPFPMWDFLRKNLTLTAGVTLRHSDALRQANEYLRDHPAMAAAYVTDVIGVSEVQKAFVQAASPARGQLKIVLDMLQ